MSFSLSAWGHAATAEAEAEIVKAAKAFWDVVTQHVDPETSSGASISTANHGSGTVDDVHTVVTTPPPSTDAPQEQGGTS